MSVYNTSFNYLGINSRIKNLKIVHFDAENGEVDTNLNLEPIYTDSALGIRRYDYGAKWNSVATFKITVMKNNDNDNSGFSVDEVRDCLKWLTGTMSNTTLELLVGEKIQCSFTGRFTNAWQYKSNARTDGLVLEFTSTSPFAYASPTTLTRTIDGKLSLQIECPSDDLYSYVYLKTTYTHEGEESTDESGTDESGTDESGNSLIIINESLGESTIITKLSKNETIIIDGPMAISSDKGKIFGNTFNFIFPRLKAGINTFTIMAKGVVTFEYIYPIKIGNVAININELADVIDCDSNPGTGTYAIEYISWENMLNKPNTIAGYGIQDAYTKPEIDEKFSEVNTKIEAADEAINKLNTSDIEWNRVINTPTTVAGYGITDVYTKEEINSQVFNIENANLQIDEASLNQMLIEALA